jgi:hypothetical protein
LSGWYEVGAFGEKDGSITIVEGELFPPPGEVILASSVLSKHAHNWDASKAASNPESKNKPAPREKTDLFPAEYKTLYRLLAVMATDKYGYDISKERQPTAIKDIISAFACAGMVAPESETVRKHLNIAMRESGKR